MATTTNYGWTTPDDTALVKDGASAIRSLGTSVDTTTKNLNPSTTLGDIEYRSSTANTNTRLAIGSTGNVLTVAGGVPTWAAPAGGSPTFIGCLLYKTAHQSIAHDTQTALTFDAESFDTDAFHSTSSNTSRITIPTGKGGKYYFGGLISAESGNNGRSLYTRVNNTNAQQVYYEQVSQSANVYFSWNLMRNLSAGDYFEVFYDQQSAVSKNIYGGSANDTSLYCVYLGA
jgi:hypothetical protein